MSGKRNKYSAKLRALAKEELIRRKSIPKLLDVCFDKQVAFIKDPSKRKALFVARRSGKSFTLAAYMILCALQNPRVKVLYIGLTKTSAENAMWTHTIEEICREFNIEHIYNRNTKTVSFKNGSTIRLTGADASPAEMARLLGGKYFLVAVDECQSYSQDLRELINTNLGPAVADYATINNGGVICMAGTPGNKLGDHYWYQVTKEGEREPGWSVHHWDCLENPHMKENILAQWEDFRVRHGDNYKETNWFKQQWLCQWVIDDIAKVYKFDEKRNVLLERLSPEERRLGDLTLENKLKHDLDIIGSLRDVDSKWRYILGVDLGWDDPNGFVVGAYSLHDRNFYIVESHKIQHITVDQIAGIIQSLHDKYKFRSMVVDTGGGGKLAAESMKDRYRLPLKPAEKSGEKAARIAAMNSDFVTENIKIIAGSNEALMKEWNELVVDHIKQKQGIFKEADSYHNHLADAALYCFNEARHFNAKIEPTREPDFADMLIEHRKRSTPPKQSFWQKQKEQLQIRQLVKKYRDNK